MRRNMEVEIVTCGGMTSRRGKKYLSEGKFTPNEGFPRRSLDFDLDIYFLRSGFSSLWSHQYSASKS